MDEDLLKYITEANIRVESIDLDELKVELLYSAILKKDNSPSVDINIENENIINLAKDQGFILSLKDFKVILTAPNYGFKIKIDIDSNYKLPNQKDLADSKFKEICNDNLEFALKEYSEAIEKHFQDELEKFKE